MSIRGSQGRGLVWTPADALFHSSRASSVSCLSTIWNQAWSAMVRAWSAMPWSGTSHGLPWSGTSHGQGMVCHGLPWSGHMPFCRRLGGLHCASKKMSVLVQMSKNVIESVRTVTFVVGARPLFDQAPVVGRSSYVLIMTPVAGWANEYVL